MALGVRIAAVQHYRYVPAGDARSYLALSGQIARGGDYAGTDRGAGDSRGPTAYFPPAYPYLLGAIAWLDGKAPSGASQVHVARVAQAVIGTLVVGFTGLVALELFGPGMALLALALAAIYPAFIGLSTVLVAETLMVAFELAAVWCALRAHRTRDPLRWVIACGLCVGMATLTHLNAVLLVIPLAIGVSSALPVFGRRSVSAVAVLVAWTLVALTPWLVRDVLVMHRFVPVSDEAGITLAGTYNPQSASATDPPYKWLYFGRVHADADLRVLAPLLSEPQLDAKLESRALTYVANHPSAPLAAGYHNTLRLLELEGRHAWRASTAAVGIPDGLATAGVAGFWALAVLALLGLFARPPEWRVPGWLWGVPWLMWLSVVLVNAETPRFREAIDPFLILLAARSIAWAGLRAQKAYRHRMTVRRAAHAAARYAR